MLQSAEAVVALVAKAYLMGTEPGQLAEPMVPCQRCLALQWGQAGGGTRPCSVTSAISYTPSQQAMEGPMVHLWKKSLARQQYGARDIIFL